MKTDKILFWLAPVMAAALLVLTAAGVAVAAPGGYDAAAIIRTLHTHVDAVRLSGNLYLSFGRPEDRAQYDRAVRELKADIDALRRLKGLSEEVRLLRRAAVQAGRALDEMEARAA